MNATPANPLASASGDAPPEPDSAPAITAEAADILRELGLDPATCAAASALCAEHLSGVTSDRSAGAASGSDPSEATTGDSLLEDARRLEALTTLHVEGDNAAGDPRTPADRDAQLARLRELLLTLAADVRVVLVAIAARLALLRRRAIPAAQVAVFSRQCLDVYAPLAGRLGVRALKWELEDLAFRAVDEHHYKRIARGLAERRADRERYVEEVVADLGRDLAGQGVAAEVSGRPKHIYSIYKKMQQKHLALEELFDLRALRVLVDDVAACYAVLGSVHTRWPHIPTQFDDYITKPKPNGYQSLHTAVTGPQGRTLEIQIRTRAMHERAEFGVAAHWQYKESAASESSADPGASERLAWMRRMLDGGAADEQPRELLERVQAELVSDRVYAVTPAGAIIDLPAGATPLDFAYAVHTSLGHQCRGAKVNGVLSPLNRPLRSGDQVDILRDRNGSPSRDWLNANLGFLHGTRARAKVRQWFRQQDYDQNKADGEQALAREFKRLVLDEPDREARSRLATRFNFSRYEDLTAAVGAGDVSTAQVAGALSSDRASAEPAPELKVRAPSKGQPEVHALGVGNLLTQLARCCSPVPPEAIRGYVTRGRGITIHRADCAALERTAVSDPERIIEIDWGEIGSKRYPVRIGIEAIDRHALVRDITATLSNERVDVTAVNGANVSRNGIRRIAMTLEVGDVGQLGRILDRVRTVSNVLEVRREQ